MKYCFIINRLAGKGVFTEQVLKNIEDVCVRNAVNYEVFMSDDIDDTKKYVASVAKELDKDERATFIACGGDGTLCKTVVSVMALPEEQRERSGVGVIPMGTGNDFVSNFQNKELFFDIEAQLDATPYSIDLLKCNDIYSVNMVNIGFDCQVVCKKEEIGMKAWVPRKLAYIFSLLITLIRKPGVKMEFSEDGKERSRKELLLTTFANGAFCGGGFNSNPRAALDDGKIDCIAVKDISRVKFLSLVGSYKKGLHLGDKFKNIIDHFKCDTADMFFDEETAISVDGEIVRERELHISVAKKALIFMVPKGIYAINKMVEKAVSEPVLQ